MFDSLLDFEFYIMGQLNAHTPFGSNSSHCSSPVILFLTTINSLLDILLHLSTVGEGTRLFMVTQDQCTRKTWASQQKFY